MDMIYLYELLIEKSTNDKSDKSAQNYSTTLIDILKSKEAEASENYEKKHTDYFRVIINKLINQYLNKLKNMANVAVEKKKE